MSYYFVKYNPHPDQKNVGDCVKRALTKASGKSYREISNELNRLKRSIGASAYNVKSVWDTYLRETLHATYKSFPAEKGKSRMNVERFCEEYGTGTYVLNVAKHMVCVHDGMFYDTWDCSDKCVYGAYEIPQEDANLVEISDNDYIQIMTEVAAEPAPTKVEKKVTGPEIIRQMAESINCDTIKKTRKGELWISLDNGNDYLVVLNFLRDGLNYKHLKWEKKRTKYYLTDEKTGAVLILKSGKGAYLWCTNA